jgi:hypothetical protein
MILLLEWTSSIIFIYVLREGVTMCKLSSVRMLLFKKKKTVGPSFALVRVVAPPST